MCGLQSLKGLPSPRLWRVKEERGLKNRHLAKIQLRHDGTGKDATVANRSIRALLK